jgi:hypothetical protein
LRQSGTTAGADILLRFRNEPLTDERVCPRADLRWGVKAKLIAVGSDTSQHRLPGETPDLATKLDLPTPVAAFGFTLSACEGPGRFHLVYQIAYLLASFICCLFDVCLVAQASDAIARDGQTIGVAPKNHLARPPQECFANSAEFQEPIPFGSASQIDAVALWEP